MRKPLLRNPLLREIAPAALLLALVWVKLSYFNLPPREVLENDWNPWRATQAAQACLATLGTLLVLLSPLLLLGPRRRLAALWVVDLLASLLVLTDVLHFRFYGDILPLSVLGNGGQLPMVYRSVLRLLRPSDALLFVDLALLPAIALVRAWRGAAAPAAPAGSARARRTALRTCLAAGLVLVALLPVRIVALDRGDTFQFSFFRFFGARKIGLLNYHLYDGGRMVSHALLAHRSVPRAERDRALAFVDSLGAVDDGPSARFGVARGRNLVLVMVESLQAFPLGMEIGGREVTPNLNAFARRSLRFDRFLGQTWEGTTSDGEFTALQSLHPLPAGSTETTYPGNHFRGLPRVLAERGYATVSAHAFYGEMWSRREVFPSLGFQEMLFREDYAPGEKVGMGLSDEEFFRQTLPRLEALPRPFGAFLITLSSHHPYDVPARYRELDLGELRGTLLGDYLQAIHYADRALGTLLRGLEADGLLDESVVVLFGDHKADLGPPGDLERLLRHASGWPAPAGSFDPRYWEERHRLPLLVHLPGDEDAGDYAGTAGHLDIAPTVLDLLGIEAHGMASLGQVVSDGRDAFVVFRDGGFALADTLCAKTGAGDLAAECRDVRSGAVLDPARFAARFADARRRLEVSDLLVRGDLIPRGPVALPAPLAHAAGRPGEPAEGGEE